MNSSLFFIFPIFTQNNIISHFPYVYQIFEITLMKYPTEKGRELAYLSLILVLSTILILLDLSIMHNRKIAEFLNNYKMFTHLDLVFKLVFLYSLVFMGILYRRYKRSLSKQHKLENIISSINPAVLMVVDNNETITMCNQSIKRILNYEVNEVINKTTDILFTEIDPQQEQIGDDVQEMIAQDGFKALWSANNKITNSWWSGIKKIIRQLIISGGNTDFDEFAGCFRIIFCNSSKILSFLFSNSL